MLWHPSRTARPYMWLLHTLREEYVRCERRMSNYFTFVGYTYTHVAHLEDTTPESPLNQATVKGFLAIVPPQAIPAHPTVEGAVI